VPFAGAQLWHNPNLASRNTLPKTLALKKIQFHEDKMGNILPAIKIIEYIKSGDLKIAYYSIRDEKKNEIITLDRWRFLNLFPEKDGDVTDQLIREFFYSNLEPDSYRCTLGPYCVIEESIGKVGKEFITERNGEFSINIKEAKHFASLSGAIFSFGKQ